MLKYVVYFGVVPETDECEELTDLRRRIATPKWLPFSDEANHTEVESVCWFIDPSSEDDFTSMTNSIIFSFEVIHQADPPECTMENNTNKVVFRSGNDTSSPIEMEFCLNELPDMVEIMSPVVRLEFISFDMSQFGFIGEYTTRKYNFFITII